MNIILGSGISSYIIATCLKYHNKDFVIYSDKQLSMPGIMLLKYKTDDQLKFYFELFGIDYNETNIEKYCKKIKVGYLFKNKIHDSLTDEMKANYLEKQNRQNTKTALSDNIQSFNAILLNKVAVKLVDEYRYYVRNILTDTVVCNLDKHNVFDTNKTITFNDNYSVEYIVNECEIDLLDYDYVYDCDRDSPIKRYSANSTEYIKEPNKKYLYIKNYYDSPKIYDSYDVKTNKHHIYIGRNATQSQIKQEDVINYMFKLLKGENYGF